MTIDSLKELLSNYFSGVIITGWDYSFTIETAFVMVRDDISFDKLVQVKDHLDHVSIFCDTYPTIEITFKGFSQATFFFDDNNKWGFWANDGRNEFATKNPGVGVQFWG